MEQMIRKNIKPVFIIWLVSVLCYLPFIAEGLTNSVDGLWASSYYQAGNIELGSGRWMLLFLDKGRGAYAAEPFSSFFALFFVSLAAYIAILMFSEMNFKLYFVGFLVPVSTTICCYLAYRFTSANYGLSVLLSVSAAWMITREIKEKKKEIIFVLISIALLVASLGIYQANLGCFSVPVIIFMMKLILNDERKECLNVFIKTIIVGISGCVLYKIAWEICLRLRHITASNYNGVDSLSIGGNDIRAA